MSHIPQNILSAFLAAYITCALWSSLDENDEPLDKHYNRDSLDPDALKRFTDDCTKFITDHVNLSNFTEENASQAGHDFWLTRNGHGTGFWDHDCWTDAEKDVFTRAAKSFKECDLYVDGLFVCVL